MGLCYKLHGLLTSLKFTKGILTNLGAMPIDRIQAMLSLAPGYDKSTEQLAGFLDSARRKGLVECNDGLWKLIRRYGRSSPFYHCTLLVLFSII